MSCVTCVSYMHACYVHATRTLYLRVEAIEECDTDGHSLSDGWHGHTEGPCTQVGRCSPADIT